MATNCRPLYYSAHSPRRLIERIGNATVGSLEDAITTLTSGCLTGPVVMPDKAKAEHAREQRIQTRAKMLGSLAGGPTPNAGVEHFA